MNKKNFRPIRPGIDETPIDLKNLGLPRLLYLVFAIVFLIIVGINIE